MSYQHTNPDDSLPRPGRAPRGSACLNCRRRKLRCDGVRPICGQCVRTNRQSDCEYTDGPVPGPTQTLEDSIARLEARIYELENPEAISPSVTLHNPHALVPQSSPGAATGMLGQRGERPDSGAGLIMPTQGTTSVAPGPDTEPPLEIIRMLVGAFLSHAAQVGFFLHRPRFIQNITVPHADVRLARLSSSLLNSVYLWGAHFLPNQFSAQEPVLLQRAVQSASIALAEGPRHNMVYTIQAEILLANYFYAANRFLEGRYHGNAAVALSLSCRFNKIRSLQVSSPQESNLNFYVPPPSDGTDEGERINAFWSVFILDKTWAVAAGVTPHFNGSPGAQVDAPWPLDIEAYEPRGLPQELRSLRTIDAFLLDENPNLNQGTSLIALRAKAAALFERAARLSAQWTTNITTAEQVAPRLLALHGLIDRFTASLPPLQEAPNPEVARELLVTHTLCLVASVKVQGTLEQILPMPPNYRLVAAESASAAINCINIVQMPYVDSILAVLWSEVCRVLFGEVIRLRFEWASASSADPVNPPHQLPQLEADHNRYVVAVQRVLAAMTTFGQITPLMAVQAAIIQQEVGGAIPV